MWYGITGQDGVTVFIYPALIGPHNIHTELSTIHGVTGQDGVIVLIYPFLIGPHNNHTELSEIQGITGQDGVTILFTLTNWSPQQSNMLGIFCTKQ